MAIAKTGGYGTAGAGQSIGAGGRHDGPAIRDVPIPAGVIIKNCDIGLPAPRGVEVSFVRLGIFVALMFIGPPFVARAVQPLIADFDSHEEEAARTLGASDRAIIGRLVVPAITHGILTGTAIPCAQPASTAR